MKYRVEQACLIGGMALATMNVWTGVPLLGLWVGSRATGEGTISMFAVLVIVATMAASAFVLLRTLAWLDVRYHRLIGRPRTVNRQVPWLRAMSGERPHFRGDGPALDALDYVLVGVVILCGLAFEIWFAFFSGSPFDQRSGRG